MCERCKFVLLLVTDLHLGPTVKSHGPVFQFNFKIQFYDKNTVPGKCTLKHSTPKNDNEAGREYDRENQAKKHFHSLRFAFIASVDVV